MLSENYEEAIAFGVLTQSLERVDPALRDTMRAAFEDVMRPVSEEARHEHINSVAQAAVAAIPELESIKSMSGFGGSQEVDGAGSPLQGSDPDISADTGRIV